MCRAFRTFRTEITKHSLLVAFALSKLFMNSKQAQLYEDLLDHFIEVDKHYSLTVQKMQVQGVKAEV